ncbi:zinc-ribbon domain-containing protein [Haloarchaeobius sp. FL176]|uniref:zinc-ribbon domain-containing protein n=1 Tax=Haloarchaeobius sp. FL176 TaxID=2967129 RepID=UPI002147AFB9|nr:zinc-ribbon domain-containing protein [Haloarchaeobius sp. FL176]
MSRDGGADATVCPSCGTRADAGDRFCSACGTALAAEKRDEPSGPTAAAAPGNGSSDADSSSGGETSDDQHDESGETVWATDPAAPEAAPTGTEPPDGGGNDRSDAAGGRNESAGAQGDADRDLTDDADAESASLEPWQKRCPECGSVLVAQAVRCTGCGTTQPDVATPDDGGDREQNGEQRGAPDASSHGESRPRRRDAAGSRSRERRGPDRRNEPRQPSRRRDPGRESRGRTTDAGGGEVQYERDRRTERVASQQEPRGDARGGYRERPGRQRPRREPPHGPAADRDRRERLAERQTARRADADTPYEPAVPSSRWWAGVLVPAVLTFFGAALAVAADPTAVAAGTVPWVGDGGGLLELAVVLTPTLAPFALYFDRRYVAHEAGRKPSAAYYLVAVPYLNIIVTGVYLWWRQQWLTAG